MTFPNRNTFIVYMHTSPNGKRYIGITCNDVQRRWQGGLGYRKCVLFFKAITKYGWDNFKHEIVYTDLTKEEACSKEKELIKEYRTNESEFGYNLTDGGEHYICNKETRDRMSYNRTHRSPEKQAEISLHLSVSLKGKKAWNKGRKATKEERERLNRMREEYWAKHKGEPMSEAHRLAIKKATKGKHKNYVCSEETREKLRIATTNYWRNKK